LIILIAEFSLMISLVCLACAVSGYADSAERLRALTL